MKVYKVNIKGYNLYILSSFFFNKLNIVVQSSFCKKNGLFSA